MSSNSRSYVLSLPHHGGFIFPQTDPQSGSNRSVDSGWVKRAEDGAGPLGHESGKLNWELVFVESPDLQTTAEVSWLSCLHPHRASASSAPCP